MKQQLKKRSKMSMASLRMKLRDTRYQFGMALLVLALVAPAVISNEYVLDMLVLSLLWGTLGVAWHILGGYAGQPALGHAGFFGIGAYAAGLLFVRLGISPWIGLVVGALLAGLFGAMIAALTFRLRGPFFILSTVAFNEVIRIVAVYWRDLTEGTVGLAIPFRPSLANLTFEGKTAYVYTAAAMLLGVYLISLWIQDSKLGYYLVAGGVDDDAARALGVNTFRAKVTATFISAALSAVAGTFYAQYILLCTPDSVFSVFLSAQAAMVSIVGGLVTPIGPIVGSLLLTPLGNLLRGWLGAAVSGLHTVIFSAILILVLLFVPEGLAPTFGRLLRRVVGRKE
jgi:branched-chain amino acid transport system permease protein